MKTKFKTWLRRDSWTLLMITVVTILIWAWAAGETRESTTLSPSIRFVVPDDLQEWNVEPSDLSVTATIEGSRGALDRAKNIIRTLTIEVPAQTGDSTINVVDALNAHAEIQRTGINVLAIDPSSQIDITVDRIVSRQASVRPALPGVQTQGEVTVTPRLVQLHAPERLASSLPEDLVVEAFVGPSELERKESGVPLTVKGRLRLPPGTIANTNHIRIEPPMADVSFTIRSIERTITLESVRIQLGGPTEDHEEYVVTIPDPILTNVEITADNDLIRQIEDGQATVVALLHLSSREKEQPITEKQIGIFVAMVHGQPGLRQVKARYGDSDEPPIIPVQITLRSQEPAEDAPQTTSD